MTDGRWTTDGRTTDNRPLHKLTWSRAPGELINELQRMFYEYLWNMGPDKIKRTEVVQNYQDGCLRMINVDIFIKTLKLTWLRRILLKNSRYSDFIQENFPFITDCLQYGSLFIENENIIIDNIFWKDIFLSLKLFFRKSRTFVLE